MALDAVWVPGGQLEPTSDSQARQITAHSCYLLATMIMFPDLLSVYMNNLESWQAEGGAVAGEHEFEFGKTTWPFWPANVPRAGRASGRR